MFSAMLTDAFRESDSSTGAMASYSIPGVYSPSPRSKRPWSMLTKSEWCNRFLSACDNFGLTISTKKTKVMFLPAPRIPHKEPIITVKGQTLQAVNNFTYLGNPLSRSANIDAEVTNRIAKASNAIGRLKKTVWERRGISQKSKMKV